MFLSFIGVNQSLTQTAYIKMIDIWMIVMMLYPFLAVTLYTLMEVIKNKKIKDCASKLSEEWVVEDDRNIKILYLLLDWGLPFFMTFFLFLFFTLGVTNSSAIHATDLC